MSYFQITVLEIVLFTYEQLTAYIFHIQGVVLQQKVRIIAPPINEFRLHVFSPKWKFGLPLADPGLMP